MTTYPTIPLKEIEIEERSQERLLRLGARALSDSQLLAMIIRSGTKGTKLIFIELLDFMIIGKKSIDPMQKG